MAEDKKLKESNEEVPQKLLDLVRAEDTTLEIARICLENKIEEDAKIRGISYHTGRVLVGDLSPKDFEKTLAEKIALPSVMASKVAREINESIFYPVKEDLALLYEVGASPSEELLGAPATKPLENAPQKRGESRGADVYREPIE